MSSAVQDAPAVAVGPRFFHEEMPIEQLRPSPLNPRKRFDQAAIEELAKSLREVGVIEPLVARPMGSHYELVAGERRWRAAQLAGLATLPVSVKSLTDAQALEIMVIENNQREDVNALEEADGFTRLLKSGYDLERLAERLGRSTKYVYDRMKLLDLVPTAKRLVTESKLTAGHAILIARLTPMQQQQVIDPGDGGAFEDDCGAQDVAAAARGEKDAEDAYGVLKPVSVRELQKYIAQHFRFNVSRDPQSAPLEYGDTAERVAAAVAKPGRGKKVVSITLEHFVQPDARDQADRTFGPQSFKFADGKPHRVSRWSGRTAVAPTCESSVLGVVVVGEPYGKSFDVCIARDKCQVHWKQEIADRSKNQKLRDSGKGAKADKNEAGHRARQEADQRARELEAKRRDAVQERALNAAVDTVQEVTPDFLRLVLVNLMQSDMDHDAFNRRFKTKVRWGCDSGAISSLTGRTLVQAIVFALLSYETYCGDFGNALKLFKVNLKAIEAQIAKEAGAAGAPKAGVSTSAKAKSKSVKKR